MKQTQHQWWRSPLFYGAVLLGPICWVVMNLLGVPIQRSDFVLKTFLLVVLVSPVLEEIVFRGGVQEFIQKQAKLGRTMYGVSLANVITSIVFAALHLLSQSPFWAAMIFFPSLIFGWSKDRYESLLPPIVLHIIYNAGFLILYGNM